MIDYIKGEIIELSPVHAVLEAGGIGYHINIALSTYSELNGKNNTKLYVYEAIREDAHVLFGFLTKEERSLFLLLISVSGVGANTARMILSSIMANELQNAIITGNVSILKSLLSSAKLIVNIIAQEFFQNVTSGHSASGTRSNVMQ